MDDSETVFFIDSRTLAALDVHHGLPLMGEIAALREKYNLHMKVERYLSDEIPPDHDRKFIRK